MADPRINIPKFQDGEFLTESELYRLSWLPFELQRRSSQAHGHVGFFGSSVEPAGRYNRFELDVHRLFVADLFVISPEGVPFILLGERRLELPKVAADETALFASVYFADSSKAFNDRRFFAVGPGADKASEAETAPNGYQVLLHWGEGTTPQIEGASRFSLELGRLVGSDAPAFQVSPAAYFSTGLPLLKDAVDSSVRTLEGYAALLLDSATAPGADRATLLDRLDDLLHGLRDGCTPTQKLVRDVHVMVRAVKGFYLRLAYSVNAQDPRYRSCQGLQGRMLEHQLRSLYKSGGDPLDEVSSDLDGILSTVPTTGHEQVLFFSRLESLFSVERSAELFRTFRMPHQRWETVPQIPSRPEPQEPQPVPPDDDSKKTPSPKKRIIPLTRQRD